MKKIEVLGPFGIKLRLVRARPTGSVFIYLFIYLFVPGFYRYRLLQPILKFWPQVEGGCPLGRFWIQPPRSTPWGTSPWVLFFGHFQYNLYEGPTCNSQLVGPQSKWQGWVMGAVRRSLQYIFGFVLKRPFQRYMGPWGMVGVLAAQPAPKVGIPMEKWCESKYIAQLWGFGGRYTPSYQFIWIAGKKTFQMVYICLGIKQFLRYLWCIDINTQ